MPPATARGDRILPEPPAPARGPLRAVPGPQADHFTDAARAAFGAAAHPVSTDAGTLVPRSQPGAVAHARRLRAGRAAGGWRLVGLDEVLAAG